MKTLPPFFLLPLMLWLIVFARIEVIAPDLRERPAGTRALQPIGSSGELALPPGLEVRPAAAP
jgi:hypothetical protein